MRPVCDDPIENVLYPEGNRRLSTHWVGDLSRLYCGPYLTVVLEILERALGFVGWRVFAL